MVTKIIRERERRERERDGEERREGEGEGGEGTKGNLTLHIILHNFSSCNMTV